MDVAGFLEEVARRLPRGAGTAGPARERVRASEWAALLAGPAAGAVIAAFSPAEVAEQVAAPRRCATCGHPLHWTAAQTTLVLAGRPRRIRNLPHLAACSCGYADRIVDPRWLAALAAHFERHPADDTADAAAPELRPATGPSQP